MSLSRLYHCFLIVIYCCLPLTGAAQESERDSLPSHSLVYVREADTYLRYFSRLGGTDITSNLDEFHHSFSQIRLVISMITHHFPLMHSRVRELN